VALLDGKDNNNPGIMEVKGKKTGVLLIYQKELWLRGA
jgi:hypothetical protein